MVSLEVSRLGLVFPNPVIAGSSGLTGNMKSIQDLARNGIGGIVLKSLFEEQILMEARREASKGGVIYGQQDIDDYIGYYEKKHSLSEYLKLIRDAKQEVGVPVIASINCASPGEWTEFASEIQSAGADALQLNIFSLRNSDPASIVREVKEKIRIPLIAKIGWYFSDLAAVAGEIEKAGADALVLFNRPYAIDFDIEKLSLKQGAYFSSQEEMSLPLRWISVLFGTVNAPMFASTGVHTGDDVVKMLLAGAAGTEVVSSLYRNSPAVIGQMKTRLESWMEAHGFETIDAFRGLLSRIKSKTPETYERVQYMKHYGDGQEK